MIHTKMLQTSKDILKAETKMHDIIIIGAGVVGAMIARKLSRYNLSVCVLEKENDVGNVTSNANSAIVHSGYDPVPGTLKAKLNLKLNSSKYPPPL